MTDNPFIGLPEPVHSIIEQLLADLYNVGEWEDRHETQLQQWRLARGEDAKGPWRWWIGEVDPCEGYSFEAVTREEAIAIGNREFNNDDNEHAFQIVEARMWSDTVKEGQDISPFAEARNCEVIECEVAA